MKAAHRRHRSYWVDPFEAALLTEFLRRIRDWEERMSILARLRHEGIKLSLGADGKLNATGIPDGAEDQVRAVLTENKHTIIGLLRSEEFAGPCMEDSAFFEEIKRQYAALVQSAEFGCGFAAVQSAIGILDGVVEMALPDAAKAFLSRSPEYSALVARIALERKSILEGPALYATAKQVFGWPIQQTPPKPKVVVDGL